MAAEENRAGIADLERELFGIRGFDLKVLGREPVDERHRGIEVRNEDDRSVLGPARAGDVAARQDRELLCDGSLDPGRERGRGCDQDRLGGGVVLGLGKQVGGEDKARAKLSHRLADVPNAPAGVVRARYAESAPGTLVATPAIRKLMQQHQLGIADVDLWELHEAYAVTTLYNQQQLQTPWETTNVNGGAVALGHPYGMSGIRYLGSTLLELRRRKKRRAVVGVCTAGGMSTAAYLEAV